MSLGLLSHLLSGRDEEELTLSSRLQVAQEEKAMAQAVRRAVMRMIMGSMCKVGLSLS